MTIRDNSLAFSKTSVAARGLFFACGLSAFAILLGCESRSDALRAIKTRQQQRVETATTVDHLREAHTLFTRIGESDLEAAANQINYHLNAWRENQMADDRPLPTDLLASWKRILPSEQAAQAISNREFLTEDVRHFRLQYLLHRIKDSVLDRTDLDPWLESRVATEALPAEQQYQLQAATRLFDWVIRNTQLEPLNLNAPAPPAPKMPAGLEFRGPGYRQTSWETLWRGVADPWQRADLFLQLCRHAGLDACMLAIPSQEASEPQPWMCGVLIGEQIFLFDTALGLPVPGPDEAGIATLQEARQDASVLRRLKVPGVFDYPFTNSDVQQCIALLDATPELLSERMHLLTQSLTGDYRMNLFLDAVPLAQRLDAVSGVAGVRLWQMPLQARAYQQAIADAMRDDIRLYQWYYIQWGLFDERSNLGRARWRHLEGVFDSDEEENITGARVLYMNLRRPEFELADLGLDVELQKQYDLRRQPGEEQQMYERRIMLMQELLRATKRTATFWIGLMHVEEGRWETAEKWLDDRVLQDPDAGRWYPLARYNLARTMERLDHLERAEELYKTNGDFQEQGNRIRARLLEPVEAPDPS